MKHISARVAATSVPVALALLLLGNMSAYAREAPDNPGNHYGQISNPGNHYGRLNNPGHHYGQLRHQPTPPPPATPAPSPTPAPVVGGTSAAQPQLNGPGVVVPTTPAASSLPDLRVALPVHEAQVQLAEASPRNEEQWLVLLILPLLTAVWLMIFARAALTTSRRRRQGAEGGAAMPAAAQV
jgi:hypothetical protein